LQAVLHQVATVVQLQFRLAQAAPVPVVTFL
jgi:hypothetical protein